MNRSTDTRERTTTACSCEAPCRLRPELSRAGARWSCATMRRMRKTSHKGKWTAHSHFLQNWLFPFRVDHPHHVVGGAVAVGAQQRQPLKPFIKESRDETSPSSNAFPFAPACGPAAAAADGGRRPESVCSGSRFHCRGPGAARDLAASPFRRGVTPRPEGPAVSGRRAGRWRVPGGGCGLWRVADGCHIDRPDGRDSDGCGE